MINRAFILGGALYIHGTIDHMTTNPFTVFQPVGQLIIQSGPQIVYIARNQNPDPLF